MWEQLCGNTELCGNNYVETLNYVRTIMWEHYTKNEVFHSGSSRCKQIHSLRVQSYLQNKSLMENYIFCTMENPKERFMSNVLNAHRVIKTVLKNHISQCVDMQYLRNINSLGPSNYNNIGSTDNKNSRISLVTDNTNIIDRYISECYIKILTLFCLQKQ